MIRPLSSADLLSRMLSFEAPRTRSRPLGVLPAASSQLSVQVLDRIAAGLEKLQASVRRLESRELLGTPVRAAVRARAARAATAPLALEATPRLAALRSSEEVNAITTSFTPFGPVVSGSTSSLPTIGGVYDGDQGDDTLLFEFRRDALVGSGQRLDVRVYAGQGPPIETLSFESLPAETALTLENGLTLSLGAGSVVRNDSFTVQVSASVGSRVDPDKPFDGARNDQPNFEPGSSVSAGSFEVNGVSIAVAADDSISSVISTINASGAGVTASFDAATESVVLTHDSPGQDETIVVGNDSSGFLAATKLDTAPLEPAQDTTLSNDPIVDVAPLSGISSGTLSINGVAIAVDTASDSLDDVVARINASEAGVTATLDASSSALSIVSTSLSANLLLDDATSGFFTAVGMAPTTYRATAASPAQRPGFRDPSAVRKDLSEIRSTLEGLLAPVRGGLSDLGFVREGLRGAVAESFGRFFDSGSRPVLRSRLGLDFDFTSDRIVEFDSKRFERASRDSFDELHEFLFREGSDGTAEGVLVALAERAAALTTSLNARRSSISYRGQTLDLLA